MQGGIYMKKALFFILTILYTGINLTAQTPEQFTGSLLWEVSGNGLKKPSYILGTHHLISENFIDSIPGLHKVINKTAQTVGEIDLSDTKMIQEKMMKASLMPKDKSYKSLLSETDYALLDESLTAILGAGLEKFGILNPVMLGSIISIHLYSQLYPEFDAEAHIGLDTYLQNIARQKGKTVAGLETVDEQVSALFYSQTLQQQVEQLLCSMNSLQSLAEEMSIMEENYRNSAIYQMYLHTFDFETDACAEVSKQFLKTIGEERNNNWLAKLPGIMKKKSSLIAVGALHLPGKEGLLYQLKLRGYKVEAVL